PLPLWVVDPRVLLGWRGRGPPRPRSAYGATRVARSTRIRAASWQVVSRMCEARTSRYLAASGGNEDGGRTFQSPLGAGPRARARAVRRRHDAAPEGGLRARAARGRVPRDHRADWVAQLRAVRVGDAGTGVGCVSVGSASP